MTYNCEWSAKLEGFPKVCKFSLSLIICHDFDYLLTVVTVFNINGVSSIVIVALTPYK